MYCRNCGNEISEKAVICPSCGVPVNENDVHALSSTNTNVVDNGGFLWGLLGCCVPVAGLVLFLIWKDTKPKTSKAAGIGAIVCVGALILLYAFIFFMAFFESSSRSYYYY